MKEEFLSFELEVVTLVETDVITDSTGTGESQGNL